MRAKYNNKKTVVDDITFDSKKEAKRYGELKLMERIGMITDLRLQVSYPFVIGGVKVATYKADFVYKEGMKEKVEDVKSEATKMLPVYRMKKKLMLACYGIEIIEV